MGTKALRTVPAKRASGRPRAKAAGAAEYVGEITAHAEDHIVTALGVRVKALRQAAGLTLEQLALRSGVSRAMLSKVERGEKSCTIGIMSRIGRGLNITLSSLLGVEPDPNTSVVFPKAKRVVFVDPETGFERHLLTAMHVDNDVEMLMHRIPPGATSGELPAYTTPTRKYIVVQEGKLTLRIGAIEHKLSAGDAAYFQVREPYAFVNPGKTTCTYYVVLVRRR